jgi:hypothetical protein
MTLRHSLFLFHLELLVSPWNKQTAQRMRSSNSGKTHAIDLESVIGNAR